jgi:hypothetical protein
VWQSCLLIDGNLSTLFLGATAKNIFSIFSFTKSCSYLLGFIANENIGTFFWLWRPEQVWKGCRQLRDSFAILSLNWRQPSVWQSCLLIDGNLSRLVLGATTKNKISIFSFTKSCSWLLGLFANENIEIFFGGGAQNKPGKVAVNLETDLPCCLLIYGNLFRLVLGATTKIFFRYLARKML